MLLGRPEVPVPWEPGLRGMHNKRSMADCYPEPQVSRCQRGRSGCGRSRSCSTWADFAVGVLLKLWPLAEKR